MVTVPLQALKTAGLIYQAFRKTACKCLRKLTKAKFAKILRRNADFLCIQVHLLIACKVESAFLTQHKLYFMTPTKLHSSESYFDSLLHQ